MIALLNSFNIKKLKSELPAVVNIYSDSQLKEIVSSHLDGSYDIVKLFKPGCKQCYKLELQYLELSKEYSDEVVRWYQADVEYIPVHTAETKNRLAGIDPNMILVPNCKVCTNTGFVECTTCSGLGSVKR